MTGNSFETDDKTSHKLTLLTDLKVNEDTPCTEEFTGYRASRPDTPVCANNKPWPH